MGLERVSLTRNRRHWTNPARRSVAGAGWRGITGQRAGAVTDAHGASGAVWPRPLRRSLAEQAKATGKWRDNSRRGGSRARQSEQRGKRGSQRRAPSAPNDKMSSNRGCRGTPQTRLLRERDRQKATVSRSVPKRGVSHRQAVISGSFPLTNRYTSPGRGLNKPLYFSRKGLNKPLYFPPRIY